MKKEYVIFFLFCLLVIQVKAQVLVGPTVGPNLSWVSFDDKEERDQVGWTPKLGFHAGATVSFRVRKRFFLNTSLLYSTKGRKLTGKKDDLYTHDVRYSYIEMPIVYTFEFKGSLGSGKEYKWYFGAGPNISYWLGGKGKFTSSELDEANLFSREYKITFNKDIRQASPDEMVVPDANRIQLGLNLSAGVVFEPLGFHKIMLMVRYELGHSFLSKTANGRFPDLTDEDPMRVRNQGVRISLSYLIDLKVEERKKGKSTIKKRRL